MSSGNIDRIPVNQLSDRYQLARSAVYKRMSDLGVEREKIGNRAYVSNEQVKLLDELHNFIGVGGNVAEFIARKGLNKPSPSSSNNSSGQSSGRSSGQSSDLALNQSDMVKLISAIAAEMSTKLQPALSARDPLAYYESLEKAAKGGWKLRTSELAELLKLDPKEIEGYGHTFYEAGFIFNRAGYRSGGEGAWLVSKR
ncbi:hypothetical protein S7335_2425 [Synechococcus sp. PCC 7335]|uniref:hypothetical protein n=1 Tax=Synechococcus sp. (strain ATCC 29403 / PCC 7335) TaxID=91464 RepID=UPI00017EE06C|nr:hypothetical protein [Synechococcus sp. PCC 7335]EDX84728.1 hypothetical protein S7335_2425 [Synechococcus sp. PCC 7335]